MGGAAAAYSGGGGGGGSGRGRGRDSDSGPVRVQPGPSRYVESASTASLDNGGLVSAQRSVMAVQDSKIQDICSTVSNLKRTSIAIHEELQLQRGLVDGLEREIDSTGARVRKAEQKSAALAGTRSETKERDSREEERRVCAGIQDSQCSLQ